MTRLLQRLSLMGFIASASIAAPLLANPEPRDYMEEGTYTGEAGSPYAEDSFTITRVGEEYTFRSVLERDGRSYRVVARYTQKQGHRFEGSGKIYVAHGDGYGCIHRFGGTIHAYDKEVVLRENTPRFIPFNPRSPCQAAGGYEWHTHPFPYKLQH